MLQFWAREDLWEVVSTNNGTGIMNVQHVSPWRKLLTVRCGRRIRRLHPLQRSKTSPRPHNECPVYDYKLNLMVGFRSWSTGKFGVPLHCITSSSSSCHAASTDILDTLSPFLPIVHRLRQVFRATSHILTELLYVCSSWSSCFFSAICEGP